MVVGNSHLFRRLISVPAGFLLVAGLSAQDYSPPAGYYSAADGFVGDSLRSALHEIIDGQNNLNYSDDLPVLWRQTEADPDNPGHILLIYSGLPADPIPAEGGWQREHTWPQSYGAGSGAAYSDAHHLYPCNGFVNSTRSNYIFDYVVVGSPVDGAPGSLIDEGRRIFEPRDEDKGRIARAQLYMDLRYDATDPEGDLVLSNSPNSSVKRFGRLRTLLEWHRRYPPDEREFKRNHIIQNGFFDNNRLIWQGNRNPFVDFPELADGIHTAGIFISRGSWRLKNFTFEELLNKSVSGDLADPEEDGLNNLLEFSWNTDPLHPTSENLPSVLENPESGIQSFSFTRLPEAEISGLTYTVEYSRFPIDSTSWSAVELTESEVSVTPQGMTERVELEETGLGEGSRPVNFRLRVGLQASSGETIVSLFDPVRFDDPDSVSIFLYAEKAAQGWKKSDWFGFLVDTTFPWIYHINHRWTYVHSQSEKQVYLYDLSLGWLWTGYGIYPALYAYRESKWLYYIEGTSAPERWFVDYDSSQYLQEQNLLKSN